MCLNFFACLLFSILLRVLSYIAFCFGLAFPCLYLFLIVFLFPLVCGELFLSECGLLWHFSLEAHPIHKRGLVKER